MANKKISNEEIEWLQAHKQNVERRTRMLKGAGVFFYCITLLLALNISVTLATHSPLTKLQHNGIDAEIERKFNKMIEVD